MLTKIIGYSIRLRVVMIILLVILLGAGGWAAKALPIDAARRLHGRLGAHRSAGLSWSKWSAPSRSR
jgi:hypothetical protein